MNIKHSEFIFPEEAVDRVCKIIASLIATIFCLFFYILMEDVYFIVMSLLFISLSIYDLFKIIRLANDS